MQVTTNTNKFDRYTTIILETDRDISRQERELIVDTLDKLGYTMNSKTYSTPARVINHSDWDEVLGMRFVVLSEQNDSLINAYLNGLVNDLMGVTV